jgi:hypothetical protein
MSDVTGCYIGVPTLEPGRVMPWMVKHVWVVTRYPAPVNTSSSTSARALRLNSSDFMNNIPKKDSGVRGSQKFVIVSSVVASCA